MLKLKTDISFLKSSSAFNILNEKQRPSSVIIGENILVQFSMLVFHLQCHIISLNCGATYKYKDIFLIFIHF